jgi:hypothetical protein
MYITPTDNKLKGNAMFISLNKLCEIRDSLHELQRFAVQQQMECLNDQDKYMKTREITDNSYEPLAYLNAVIDEMTQHIVAEVK